MMRLAWQRCLHVAVDRETGDTLTVRAHFSDTEREDHLTIELATDSFAVRRAVIETPRPQWACRPRTELDVLIGCVLYLKQSGRIRSACARWENHIPLPTRFEAPSVGELETPPHPPGDMDREHLAWLVCESVTNVFQAEAFLWSERGHRSAAQYIDRFHRLFADGCIMYAGKQESASYSSYTQGQARRDSLFGRHRAARVYRNDAGWRVVSFVCDSFHEIEVRIDLDDHANITAADGDFLRAPGTECHRARLRLNSLPGLRLDPDHKQQILSLITGPEGCSHLGDLVFDAVQALAGCMRREEG